MDFKCVFLVVCFAFAAQGSYVKTLHVDDMAVKTVSSRQTAIDCFKQFYPEVIAAGQTLKGEMKHCVGPVIEDVKEWYAKLTEAIADDIEGLMSLMKEMEACGSNIMCRFAVAKDIATKLAFVYEKVAGMVDELIGSLEGDFPEVAECAMGALDAFEAIMNEIVGRFKECLKNAHENEMECIKQMYPDVIAAGQTLRGEMKHCVDPVIEDVKEWYAKLTVAIADDIEGLKSLMKEMEACGNNIMCRFAVAKDIATKLVSTYEKVAEMVDELISSLEGDFPEVGKCAMAALDAFEVTMNEIVDRFLECRA